MAQGNVRAFRNVAGPAFHGLAPRENALVISVGNDQPLVPTAVAAALYLPASRFGGQQLAGSGALVWEGEALDRPSRDSIH
jgi:hypothetical protein